MKQEVIRINLNGVNCYLLKEQDTFILVDTGGHLLLDKQFDDRQELLLKEMSKAGCSPENLNLIVLTHGDNDHVANAAVIKDKYQAQIAMHPADVALVDHPSLGMVMKNFKFKSPLMKLISFFMKKPINKIIEKTLKDYISFKPDILLCDGHSLLAYGFDAKIIHIPGHTDGSIGILTASDELIAGDSVTNVKKPGAAQNASDFKTLKESIKRLKQMNIKCFYPGHGEPFNNI